MQSRHALLEPLPMNEDMDTPSLYAPLNALRSQSVDRYHHQTQPEPSRKDEPHSRNLHVLLLQQRPRCMTPNCKGFKIHDFAHPSIHTTPVSNTRKILLAPP
ncbi:hypothetical protein BYT27DRAFT_7250158 [Phlegmacium glaucopus]|nr:hypothetical protein BYT27DRAFT_7250158 [Phlegmacium glaucopus]